MKTNTLKVIWLFVVFTLTASILTMPPCVSAQDGKPGASQAEKAKKPRPYPFHGKVGSVDLEKKSFTIHGKERSRTFYLTDETKIVKDDKPAKFDELKVGEEVAGQVLPDEDGKLELVSLRIGPKPEKEQKPKKEKPTKESD